jgi:hypothetical protein
MNKQIIISSSDSQVDRFYYHPPDPNDWIHTLQEERLFPKGYGHICLNSPLALQTVIESVSKIKTDKIISISQRDNDSWCDCEKCSGELPSETLIRFVNQVARTFPDRKFSTLAYFQTERPPQTKPLPNVEVIITTIEIPKSEPYQTSNRDDVVEWRRRLNGWLKLTRNVVVWDYYSNFRHLLMPYPVLLYIGRNIQWFHQLGIRDFIMQTDGGVGHEFSEVKEKLIHKMISFPFLPSSLTLRLILQEYYGASWKNVWEYIHRLHDLQKGGYHLINWGDPSEFRNSFLSDSALREYHNILEPGLSLVTGRQRLRLETVLLQLYYTEVVCGLGGKDELVRICKQLGGVTINEHNDSYKTLFK